MTFPALCMLTSLSAGVAAGQTMQFSSRGWTDKGEWTVDTSFSPGEWEPQRTVQLAATFTITEAHLKALEQMKIVPDGFVMLMTAERTFDSAGRLRLPSDERMSTLLTPAGLPIEGGVQGAVTDRFGYKFRTPVDVLVTRTMAASDLVNGTRTVTFHAGQELPENLPPGIYRLRMDFGVTMKNRYYSLCGEAFAYRPSFKGRPTESNTYSPPIRASGWHVSGRWVDASRIQPLIPWVLLNNYNSNGYRGVVAEADKPYFGVSGRNLIQDEIILPRFAANGATVTSYNLEPQFPTDTIELRSNIPWDYTRGDYSVEITNPDGTVVNLGKFPFVGNSGQWPTTRKSTITAWKPPAYGRYTVKAAGWISDIWGNRYEGGGTYRFWIAKRMTLATATFQGQAYPVGGKYGRDLGFAPAVPADVTATARLFVNSDPNNVRTATWSGKASPSGIFTAAQGNKSLTLDAPGEYLGEVLATYTDAQGHLWVSAMKHAGVVYPLDSPIEAHGKRFNVKGKWLERGDTNFEGYMDPATGEPKLAHIAFPWRQGDVLLIASEGFGANKIEPMLTYQVKAKPENIDAKVNGVGNTNLMLRTSNGYSPHLFPEYITDWEYCYGAAPRPGFMSRFIVMENGVRAPYWPTSPNSFGGQINASTNGDMPGDIYRLLGGVVLRRKNDKPAYAGYMASAFIIPGGSNNNRVIEPGSENLLGSNGEMARVFLVSTRPGMVYETGTAFTPVAQIDPMLPVNISYTLQYPDGKTVLTSGQGDASGSWAGKDRWTLDQAGVYRFRIEAEWNGYRGGMPGLPGSGGEIYVIEKERPRGFDGMQVELKTPFTFAPDGNLQIAGTSSAQEIHYAAVIPGAVIDQGVLRVNGGRFTMTFDPRVIHQRIPTYDILNRVSQKPEIREVVHLTIFSKETAFNGESWHAFRRFILRGTEVIAVQ
jgi:hypothetical protein